MTKKEILQSFRAYFVEAESSGVFDADTGPEDYDFGAVLRTMAVLRQVDEALGKFPGDVVGQLETFYGQAHEKAANYLADYGVWQRHGQSV